MAAVVAEAAAKTITATICTLKGDPTEEVELRVLRIDMAVVEVPVATMTTIIIMAGVVTATIGLLGAAEEQVATETRLPLLPSITTTTIVQTHHRIVPAKTLELGAQTAGVATVAAIAISTTVHLVPITHDATIITIIMPLPAEIIVQAVAVAGIGTIIRRSRSLLRTRVEVALGAAVEIAAREDTTMAMASAAAITSDERTRLLAHSLYVLSQHMHDIYINKKPNSGLIKRKHSSLSKTNYSNTHSQTS